MNSVFVSYSHKDMAFAKKFVQWLETNGYKVWVDKNKILPGANYINSIADAIKEIDVLIPLLSKDSVSSKWVAREIFFALENDKDIIPVLVEFANIPEGLKFAITGLHHVDFTNPSSMDDPWGALESALRSKSTDPETSQHKEDEAKVSASRKLMSYVNSQAKKKNFLWGTVVGLLLVSVVVLSWRLADNKQNSPPVSKNEITVSVGMPQQEKITIKGISSEIETTLRIAYSSEIKEKAPTAAIAVMMQEKAGGTLLWRQLRDGGKVSSADNYRIMFQAEEPAFFYIFQIDSTGKLDWLYPRNNSSPYSMGANPVQPGSWIQLPGENEAFHLDENVGMEHIYIVATRSPWADLEQALAKAATIKTGALPVTAAFNLKTRGVGGTRMLNSPPPQNIQSTASEYAQLIKGKKGVLVQEKWFQHVSKNTLN